MTLDNPDVQSDLDPAAAAKSVQRMFRGYKSRKSVVKASARRGVVAAGCARHPQWRTALATPDRSIAPTAPVAPCVKKRRTLAVCLCTLTRVVCGKSCGTQLSHWPWFCRHSHSQARDKEMVFIGMRPKADDHLLELQAEKDQDRVKRKAHQIEYKAEYENALVEAHSSLLEEKGPEIRDTLLEERRSWIFERMMKGELPPKDLEVSESCGACAIVEWGCGWVRRLCRRHCRCERGADCNVPRVAFEWGGGGWVQRLRRRGVSGALTA